MCVGLGIALRAQLVDFPAVEWPVDLPSPSRPSWLDGARDLRRIAKLVKKAVIAVVVVVAVAALALRAVEPGSKDRDDEER